VLVGFLRLAANTGRSLPLGGVALPLSVCTVQIKCYSFIRLKPAVLDFKGFGTGVTTFPVSQ